MLVFILNKMTTRSKILDGQKYIIWLNEWLNSGWKFWKIFLNHISGDKSKLIKHWSTI